MMLVPGQRIDDGDDAYGGSTGGKINPLDPLR
jgi:hypothetical protein